MDPITQQVVLAAAGAAGADDATYVDDVFSTFLYDGTGSTQSINNGIDLSGEGGLVWAKVRNSTIHHTLVDTERGGSKYLRSSSSDAEGTDATMITSFNSDGFTIGSSVYFSQSPRPYATWTFRKAPGFFDIVTYTGTGSPQNISHSLGSVPGMMIVKCTSDGSTNWTVFHRKSGHPAFSQGGSAYATFLNTTATADASAAYWNNTVPTSTVFTVGVGDKTNGNGKTYVAYIFGHDDQSFGANSDEAVIHCGSFTGSASDFSVDIGFEPQWILFKTDTNGRDWMLFDNMRPKFLRPNLTNSESGNLYSSLIFEPKGFRLLGQNDHNADGETTVFMAIRRPHKPPTAGTEVFKPVVTTSTPVSVGFPTDLIFSAETGSAGAVYWVPRLTNTRMQSTDTSSETDMSSYYKFDLQNSFSTGSFWGSAERINYYFKRAAGFFDVVTFVGTGSARTLNHNLAAIPELVIVKNRENGSYGWSVYVSHLSSPRDKAMYLNDTMAAQTNNAGTFWGNSDFTSTQISLGDYANTNHNNINMIAYLFATLDGISKVGTYSGTGSDVNVDCGFTAGARFVIIKRTDTEISGATGTNWYAWDTARGIVSGNDPYVLLNSTVAPVTNTDYIDPLNAGFTVTSSAPAALNTSGGTYLFLAIA